jgi:hypothetical protein
MPRGIPNTKVIESQEQQIGQKVYVDMPVDGPLAGMIRTDQNIEVVTDPLSKSYADELMFNEELVDVMVHESTDPNAEPMPDVYVEGVPQRFMRGQVQTVKRKFLAVLAGAKQVSIQTQIIQQPDAVYNRINKHSALRYPFSVHRDPNPRGASWLKGILASA